MQLNHTIVWSRDEVAASRDLADVLGLPEPSRWGPFEIIDLDNGVSLDFHATADPIAPQHYAFLVTEDQFDAVVARLEEHGRTHWADPARHREGINTHDGGRGTYWLGHDDHFYEVITRPYGSGE